jgi:hypothetical protein
MDNVRETKNDKLQDARQTQKERIIYLLYKLE